MGKSILKKLLSECHWPAESSVYNLIKDKSADFYITNAQIAIQTALVSPSPEEADKHLIYAIRMINMARAANKPPEVQPILPIQERFHEPGDKPTASI